MPDIICCDGCRTGNSKISQLEIEEQRKKYGGVYICKYCEDIIDKINSSNGQNKDFLGRDLLVSRSGIYYHDGRRLMPPKTKFLGFGGSYFLIETKDEVYLTNNLFLKRSFHELLSEKIDEDKINILNIKHLSNREAEEFKKSKSLINEISKCNSNI